jgi:hypothetical protein
MKKRYYLSGISNDDRIKAMSEITEIVDRYATILNFQRFSDVSLSMVLEIEEFQIKDLQANLKKIMSIDDLVSNPSDSKTDCLVLLNITFTKGTGDLEIEVPNIPG